MTIAAKHMDPIVGIDIHIILIPTPAGPVPTPLPNPFVGMVLDPFDYAPFIGATVYINGMPRGQAGTGGIALPPHLPLGGPFGPPPPGNEAEIFMGSATVATDGDAQSRLALPALTCQSIGMPSIPRLKGKPGKSLFLPTSLVLAIPMGPPVLVGGPPTISLMAMAFKAGFAVLGKLGKMVRKAQRGAGRFGDAMRAITKKANRAGDKLADALKLGAKGRQRISNAICTVTGHPVDVATGRVFTEKIDLELRGPLPFVWKRSWSSTSTYRGDLGHGWHHNYQLALYVDDEVVLYRDGEGRAIALPVLAEGQTYYDRTERLTLQRDRAGYALRTIDGKLHRFRDVGRAHDQHVLSAIYAPGGSSIQLNYDDRGWLAEIVDSAGRSIQLSHDRDGRITAISAPHPDKNEQRFVVVQYAYDDRGNLARVIDALGQPASYVYDRNLLIKETDRNGLNFFFEYDRRDEHGRCIHTWGDGGIYDHKLKYDVGAGLTWVENSLGHTTKYRHEDGLVVEVVDAAGAITKTEYNEHDQKVKETDPLGGVKTWKYDERGNTIELCEPDGAKLVLVYGEHDKPTAATDQIGGQWKWSYDEHGRLIERTNPLGAMTQLRYAGARLSAVIDALGHVTGLTHDANGLLAGLHAPDGGSRSWQYDRLGRPVLLIDQQGNEQRRSYDLLSRLTRIEEPDGNVRQFAHDGEGNVVHAQDANHDVRFGYRGMARLAFRSEAETTVRFEYDSEERLTGVVNEHGHVYRFARDETGEVVSESGYDGVRRSYERDAAGQVLRMKRASELETRYAYDKAGRITLIEYGRLQPPALPAPDGATVPAPFEPLVVERYAYRRDGELVQASNGTATLRFERDALGRVVKETQGKHSVASQYDLLGMRSQMRSSLGAALDVERNAMSDVTAVVSQSFAARIERDQLGNELTRQLPGGVRSRWQRDKLGRPIQHELHASDVLLRARSYRWEKGDRLSMVVDALRGPTQYTHDALGNLAAAAYSDGNVELRMPDAIGNLFRRNDRKDRVYGPASCSRARTRAAAPRATSTTQKAA